MTENKTNLISTDLPDEMIKKLDELALKKGLSRNEIITLCLKFAFENISSDDEISNT